MVEVLAVLGLAALAAALVWGWRRLTEATAPGPRREAWTSSTTTGARVVLDLGPVDPDDPSVQRLVREAASRALASDREVDEVTVVARDGSLLGRERRPDPLPADVALPEALIEPHAPARHGPHVVPSPDPGHPRWVVPVPIEVHAVPLAERLELPAEVRDRVSDPDRASDVIRAILEAAGRIVQADGDLLVSGDLAVAVVDTRAADRERALNHAFLRIQATDASRGLIVRLGYVDPVVTARREAAAPHVRHVGPDAIQRMADAVAVGADPVAFAAGPVTVR